MSFFHGDPPRVFGHRGAAGLAPENTLPSFALSVALGASYVELDVRGTRDGKVVVIHDSTLDRTTNGTGLVVAHTYDQLAALDAGYRFTPDGNSFPYRGQRIGLPTLESVLTLHATPYFNIEIKQEHPAIVETVVEIIERTATLDRVLLAAEHAPIMAVIRSVVGDRVVTGMSAMEVVEFMDRFGRDDWAGYRPAGRALQIPPRFGEVELVTAATVAAAHRCGLEVHVWTVNDAEEIGHLLDLGVDGIMSDLPGLVSAAVAERAGTTRGA
jgi:glycerophosphoryl diester phosphodiesterase